MARRTVCTIQGPEGSQTWARVMRCTEWDEYVVVGYHHATRWEPETDYHTDCQDDAKATAKLMLAQYVQNGGGSK